MSNALAIAAATLVLSHLLDQALNTQSEKPGAGEEFRHTRVTTLPPDKAREHGQSAPQQLNLFLFHTEINAALRNMSPSQRMHPGEVSAPALALTLFYLITAYGTDDEEPSAHLVLGRAMQALHDHPVLGRGEIRDALHGNDLWRQIEGIRITAEPLTIDDMYKLWNSFQTQYRASAAYQVSAVLIESQAPVTAPLPVLRRKVGALPSTIPPFAELAHAEAPHGESRMQMGDRLVLRGRDLPRAQDRGLRVRFKHVDLRSSTNLAASTGASDKDVPVQIPAHVSEADSDRWAAGIYALTLGRSAGGHGQEFDALTNVLAFPMAPRIESFEPKVVKKNDEPALLSVTCVPWVQPAQTALLILGDRLIPEKGPAREKPRATMIFDLSEIPAGTYYLRLRIDAVDSVLVDRSGPTPVFDPAMKVFVT